MLFLSIHEAPPPPTVRFAHPQEPERTELESFLCPYYGAVKVSTDGYISDDGNIIEGTTTFFLVIADLCAGFDSSCVLDVKMGRTTVEPGEREVREGGT